MSSQVDYHRSPCPGRIFEDLGVGFSIGCAGGSIFYFLKGMKYYLRIGFINAMCRNVERSKKTKNHLWFNTCEE